MIRLRTLGHVSLEHEDGTPASMVLAQPKRLALLMYLACFPIGSSCPRDTLLALLWPELDDLHARTALRQALHVLRRSLDARAITGSGDARVGIDPAWLWCDATAFRALLEAGDPGAALALYRGPFLDGFHVSEALEFERWVDQERRRLERDAVAAAWRLVDTAAAAGDVAASRRWAERALELAPYDETGMRGYLTVLERQADATAAITAFTAHERRLAQELGVEPSPETIELIARIRTSAPRERPFAPSPPPQEGAAPMVRASEPPPVQQDPPATAAMAANGASPTALTGQARRRLWPALALAAVIALAGASAVLRSLQARSTHTAQLAIAVLPFRTLAADSAHAYFADGLHDEVLSQLTRASSLRVMGRTSISGYRETSEPLSHIARELGVQRIVEGSVEIEGNRLRVIVQLIEPSTGANLWAERYDRSLDDAFAVQSEIAERIAGAVGATLPGAETALRAPPPPDGQAYQLYLQGLEYARRPGLRTADFGAAAQLFERALAIDSTFAPTHAELALVYWRLSVRAGAPSGAALLDRAAHEAETALRLAPRLPRGYLALGLTRYLSRGDRRGALDQFQRGLRNAPGEAELWRWVGLTYRSLGAWDSAFLAFDRARRVEPRDANLLFDIGETRHYLHRFAAAVEAYHQALALAPDFLQAHVALAWSYFLWQGQLDTLRAVLRSVPPDADPGAQGESIAPQRLTILLWTRQPDSVLAGLRGAEGAAMTPVGRLMIAGQAHVLRGDSLAARAAYDSARLLLDSAVYASPGDLSLHGARGTVLAELGRRQEALREVRLVKASEDYHHPYAVGWMRGGLSPILIRLGEFDEALADMERDLAGPSVVTVHQLRLSPGYDPIRRDSRFQALLRKYAHPALDD